MSDDEDSLFGSPPPSPQAGVLALPRSSTEGSRPITQNVGTIALPGSHPDSELPMNPLALSLNHGIVQWPPAQMQSAHASSCTPSCSGSSTRASTPRAPAPPKKKKRRKEKEATPEPQFILPDPSAPPPPNFLRNQENLLGRAGRVGGVKPASITHTRGATSSNPILIEDDDTPMLGRRTREKSSQPYIDPSLLSAPTNQEIVQVLIGQKDIFPILEGVLKLVMRSATAPVPPAPVRTGFERGPPPPAPPTKKRKLNRVPAGAADWDVPFPFQDGDGPKSYQNTWERERGKRLISELIKLIKNAARKAATKKYLQEQDARRRESEEPQSSIFGTTSTFPPWLCAKRPTTTNVLQDASNSVTSSASVSTPNTSSTATTTTATTTCATTVVPTPTPETSDSAFHQLMASLNEAIPNSEHTSVNPLYVSKPPEADTNTDTNTISGVDQPIFDTWMSFLETFPMSFNGTPSSSSATSLFGDQTSFSSSSQSECSTPGIGIGELSAETLQALDAAAGSMTFAQASEDYDAMLASIFGVGDSTQASGPGAPPPPIPNPLAFDESLIDPSLMGLSMQPSATASTSTSNTPATATVMTNDDFDFSAMFMDNHSGSGVGGSGMQADFTMSQLQVHTQSQPQQAPSPVASTSSMGNNDPSTPASAVWDLSAPDVFMEGAGGVGGGRMGVGMGIGGFGVNDGEGGLNLDPADWNNAALGLPSDFVEIGEMGEMRRRVDKGKQRAIEVEPPSEPGITPTPTSSSSLPPGEIPIPPAESIISALLQAPTGTTLGSSLFVPKPVVFYPARNLKKDEVVKRAQERRKQLKEELDGVKMRLWETTVEQAGIMTLMRRMDETQSRAKAAANTRAEDQERTGGMSVSGP